MAETRKKRPKKPTVVHEVLNRVTFKGKYSDPSYYKSWYALQGYATKNGNNVVEITAECQNFTIGWKRLQDIQKALDEADQLPKFTGISVGKKIEVTAGDNRKLTVSEVTLKKSKYLEFDVGKYLFRISRADFKKIIELLSKKVTIKISE